MITAYGSFIFRDYYLIKERKNGEWEERKEYSDYTSGYSPIYNYYIDYDKGNVYGGEFLLSQTLFNSDNLYEYLRPVNVLKEGYSEERDNDYDGETDYISTSYNVSCIGFDIVSENGNILQTIKLDNKYSMFSGVGLLKVNGKYFLRTTVTEDSSKGRKNYFIIYSITPGTSAIRQIGQPIRTSVRQHDNMVTIETAPQGADRKLTVTNVGGKAVWSQTVPAGQTSVQVDASHFSKGVNIVSVNGDKPETCKVIIR